MGADKNFLNENFGLYPNTNPRTSLLVNSRSRSYERATDPEKLLGSTSERFLVNYSKNLPDVQIVWVKGRAVRISVPGVSGRIPGFSRF
jgi:hypothetical protein